jgi:hypothetical protein
MRKSAVDEPEREISLDQHKVQLAVGGALFGRRFHKQSKFVQVAFVTFCNTLCLSKKPNYTSKHERGLKNLSP